jgi:hypothetical protein
MILTIGWGLKKLQRRLQCVFRFKILQITKEYISHDFVDIVGLSGTRGCSLERPKPRHLPRVRHVVRHHLGGVSSGRALERRRIRKHHVHLEARFLNDKADGARVAQGELHAGAERARLEQRDRRAERAERRGAEPAQRDARVPARGPVQLAVLLFEIQELGHDLAELGDGRISHLRGLERGAAARVAAPPLLELALDGRADRARVRDRDPRVLRRLGLGDQVGADAAAAHKRLEGAVRALRDDLLVKLAGVAADEENLGAILVRRKAELEDVPALAHVAHQVDVGEGVGLREDDLIELHLTEIMHNVALRSVALPVAEVKPSAGALHKAGDCRAAAVLAARGGHAKVGPVQSRAVAAPRSGECSAVPKTTRMLN